MNIILQLLLFLAPWPLRRVILNKLYNWEISKTAKIGFSIVRSSNLSMDTNAKIMHLTYIGAIDNVVMSHRSKIGALNFVTGFSSKNKNVFKSEPHRNCELKIGKHSAITSRHYIDCNGGVYIGDFSTIAGIRSTILTHSIDVYSNTQKTKSVYIGDYNFIGTNCILLGGSQLPNYSVLAAASTLNKFYTEELCLYAGVPAREIKKLNINNVSYFTRDNGYVK